VVAGQREADVEQHLKGVPVLRPLHQRGGQRGVELAPVGEVDVTQAGEGVQHLDHGHGHAGVPQPVEELQQRGLDARGRSHRRPLSVRCTNLCSLSAQDRE
jgi:hypothetical protein